MENLWVTFRSKPPPPPKADRPVSTHRNSPETGSPLQRTRGRRARRCRCGTCTAIPPRHKPDPYAVALTDVAATIHQEAKIVQLGKVVGAGEVKATDNIRDFVAEIAVAIRVQPGISDKDFIYGLDVICAEACAPNRHSANASAIHVATTRLGFKAIREDILKSSGTLAVP